MKLRPLVRRFAEEMEKQLRENDHKDGQFKDVNEVFQKLVQEVGELACAMTWPDMLERECADVANFCAMLIAYEREDWPWVNDGVE